MDTRGRLDRTGKLHRMTVADRRLARRADEARTFAARLSREAGIQSVIFDACAGTLLVAFDPDRTSCDGIRDRLRDEGLREAPGSGPGGETYELFVRFGPALPRLAAMTAAFLR